MTERIVQLEVDSVLEPTPFEVVALLRRTISEGTGLSVCVTRMGPEVVVRYEDDRVVPVLNGAVERVCAVYSGFSDKPILVKRGFKTGIAAPTFSMT